MSVNEVKIKRAPTAFELRGTGPPTSHTFVLGDEDHTLGNALRHVLMNDARVDFAGYCVPHPSEPIVHLRIQSNTTTNIEQQQQQQQPLTAIEALKEACATLASQCDVVLEKLIDAAPEVKEDCERMERIREEEELRINDDDDEEDDDDGEDEEGEEEMYEDE